MSGPLSGVMVGRGRAPTRRCKTLSLTSRAGHGAFLEYSDERPSADLECPGAATSDLPGMDEATENRVRRYRPTEGSPRGSLDAEWLDLVRGAVASAGPASPDEASRLLTHTAEHVAWAIGNGERVERELLFSADVVEASIAAPGNARADDLYRPSRSTCDRWREQRHLGAAMSRRL